MNNPFLLNKSISVYDERINEEVIINITNIAKYFKEIYILCPFNCDNIDMNIFVEKTIDRKILDETINKMVLYKTNISIVKNIVHYGNIIYFQKDIINNANKFGYNLNDEVLILPIYNIAFLNIQKYIDYINGLTNFNNLYDIIIINNYFGDNIINEKNKLKITNMIQNLEDSTYWELSYNCLPNISKLFEERKFNFTVIKNKVMNDILEKISNSPIKDNYIEQIFNRKNYVDPSEIINRKGYKLYWKETSCEYSNNDINKLFDLLDDKQKYYLFCNLCVSKKYCHLVINNEYIINMMTPTINKYITLFNYLFGYAWLRFYFEETINRYNVKTNDMYIFDINTASKLPVFHFDHYNPHKNAYTPLLVSNNILKPDVNACGVINNKLDNRICTLEEFRSNMNVFISGFNNINLLENINFKDLKIAITGSIMTACCNFNHPLMSLFNNIKRYFNEYYYESDIDVMVKSDNIYQFMDITKQFHEKIMLNCCQYLNANPEHIKYNLVRTTYLFVTSDFIKEHICPKNNIAYDVVVQNLELKPITNLFVPFAKKMHDIDCKKKIEGLSEVDILKLMDKYADLFLFDASNLVIKIKDNVSKTTLIKQINHESEYSQEEIEMMLNNNMDEEKFNITIKMIDGLGFSDNYKAKISAPQLDRDFELFPIFKDDFMTTVANFHMPCVRAYYNGENVYMTPSFITAHMTYMNIDYKYFAGSKDPINIINKYRMRGFGCWLNKNELETYIKYNNEIPFWKNLFNINPNNRASYNRCFGPLDIMSNIFKPRLYNNNLITGNVSPTDSGYLTNTNRKLSEIEYNVSKFNTNIVNNIKFINSDTGYIEPLDRTVITLKYETHSPVSLNVPPPLPPPPPPPMFNVIQPQINNNIQPLLEEDNWDQNITD
jgi:hypothetical protein